MHANTKRTIVAGVIVLGVIVSWVAIQRIHMFPLDETQPATLLEPGWQFYPKPTTLEPPGTVFRIDGNGRRFLVDVLDVSPMVGTEEVGRTERVVEVNANLLARILGGNSRNQAGMLGTNIGKLQFEMIGTQREAITDQAIDNVLRDFPKKVKYRKDNRYYVIRESRSATEVCYVLSEELVDTLGGEGTLGDTFVAEGYLSARKGKGYSLKKVFQERTRIMFLPEEIAVIGASLSDGTPEFGTEPVGEMLAWTDSKGG